VLGLDILGGAAVLGAIAHLTVTLEAPVTKYLVRSSLSADGLKGTLKEGGTKRRDAVAELARSVGGKLEAFYYAFGEDDIYAIFDAPDNVSAATASVTAAAAGAGRVTTVVLITPEEMDQVAQKHAQYRPPGA
jgi:uncharacterized protein with GYD domain